VLGFPPGRPTLSARLVLPASILFLAASVTSAAPLFDNLGTYHYPITTNSESAQRYFDQGLRLTYGFNHDEAERSFREAARLDPECAMAWWGVALCLGPNINLPIDPDRNKAAYEAIQKGLTLSSRASEREAALIGALSKRYSPDSGDDRASLDRAYADAMRDVHRRYPDDLDAATLFAESLMDLRPWRLWSLDGRPAEGTDEIVAVLESVLKRSPNHPGANHYYIHAVEASPDPGRALASARRLETLLPGAGHLVHMPAHVYIRTGDYASAVKANRVAAGVDEAYIKAHDIKGIYPLMYYDHNLHFLAMAAAMEGSSKTAREAAAKLIADAGPEIKKMPMAEYFLPTALYVALRFQRWDDVLRYPEPDAAFPTTHALWRFARGVTLAARQDPRAALEEQKAFAADRDKVPDEATFNLNFSRDVLEVASFVVEARIAGAQGDRARAIEAWKKAADAQDRLAYDEPPIWYYPVRESLGGELLRAGEPGRAEPVFRDDLKANPKNGRSLFGLWQSLLAQKKSRKAEAARREFETSWKNADVVLRVEDL
jgi:tetratricopeptide (TPR) repeat protein